MCGIAGIISPDPEKLQVSILKSMAGSLAHRGPDAESWWTNEQLSVGFAHRRLCVIDKSREASQPMHYLDRYTIVFNGEIYNYTEIREVLIRKGHHFKSASDTEVILAAYAEYGELCLQHFDGMFSFAIWDESEKKLFCARDRFGEKPFYYLLDRINATFYFGSEMKALYAAGVSKTRNNGVLLRYLALGETGDASDLSQTFDNRIKKLPASHFILYSPESTNIKVSKYWELNKTTLPIKFDNAVEQLHALLATSIKRRLRSDVSLGMSLSGGVDSSAIAAVIANAQPGIFKTFTAVFPGFEKDEGEKASSIAELFHFENYTATPDATGFVNELDKLLRFQEEPFSSSSVYAQYKVFERAAEESVTVLLDGQGADEILAGYDKYKKWKWRAVLPAMTSAILNQQQHIRLNSDKNLDVEFRKAYADQINMNKPEVRELNDLLHYNIFCSGLEELLRYADRNSMAHGREVRLPFLYHELVSFVFSLPSTFKIGNGYTKKILREAFKERLPRRITHQSDKIGFEPPQKKWMNDNLFKEQLLQSKRMLVSEGILSKNVLDKTPVPHDAYDRYTLDWRWLIAAKWIAINKKGV